MIKLISGLLIVLLLGACSDERTVSKSANSNADGSTNTNTISSVVTMTENGVLPAALSQSFVCYDYAYDALYQLELVSDGSLWTDRSGSWNQDGSYSVNGQSMALYIDNYDEIFYEGYHLTVEDSVDFFQALIDASLGYDDQLSCITTVHDETDKVLSPVTIACPAHGTFVLDASGFSTFQDNSANTYYGTYYSDSATGLFLLHYMTVGTDGSVGLVSIPAQVRGMHSIDLFFDTVAEQCSY